MLFIMYSGYNNMKHLLAFDQNNRSVIWALDNINSAQIQKLLDLNVVVQCIKILSVDSYAIVTLQLLAELHREFDKPLHNSIH